MVSVFPTQDTRMKPVLAVRHVPHEPLGQLETFLNEAGLAIQTVDLFNHVPQSLDLRQAAALIVMGGPMNVDQTDRYPFLARDVEWIRQALELHVPMLGICLGAQLLAKALGARVYANGVKEIGWYPLEILPAAQGDPLFAGARSTETVFQWHGDTFDLPAGAVHLAQSRQCKHQAFRYGQWAYGLQFHIEMTPDMVQSWLADPGNRDELAQLDYIDPSAILAQTPEKMPAMAELGRRVLGRFAAEVFRRQ